MQFFNILFLAFAAASVDAKCWKSGPKTQTSNISPYVGTVCNYLAGGYLGGEERYVCVVDNIGVKWNFSLERVSKGGTRQIDSAECQNGMNKEIKCEFGGSTEYGNWKYGADPNSGRCQG
ncbi:MAG: hypothetical protein M1836_003775 [Candelina mexicana]|nr:MAG: hypothetical protein M1836_003775 [Candelina mexicana]